MRIKSDIQCRDRRKIWTITGQLTSYLTRRRRKRKIHILLTYMTVNIQGD